VRRGTEDHGPDDHCDGEVGHGHTAGGAASPRPRARSGGPVTPLSRPFSYTHRQSATMANPDR
jgi:hypothetical protein